MCLLGRPILSAGQGVNLRCTFAPRPAPARALRHKMTTTQRTLCSYTREPLVTIQVHHNCNPLSAFHSDNVWLSFKEGDEETTMKDDTYGGESGSGGSTTRPLYCGPPRVSGVGLTVDKRFVEFEDSPEGGKQQ